MKNCFVFYITAWSFLFIANVGSLCSYEPLKPLWQDEEHFAYYRTLQLESRIGNLKNLIDEAKENPQEARFYLDEMSLEIESCQYLLGIN